ncbi:ABC transporter permease [Paenibacillus hunanensis]|uniref:ABC transporter permease n=1 Tax=Paenibacillus hunanensis TaxID=539262 RepID=UPI002025E20C|nr:ABC transporter permease [Paenibacillus hunanensis]MCL9660771.1 ABC transporter permease [Paenibacillus hunanensis]
MNKLGAVIAFTYRNKVKTKSFRITTLLLAVLLIVALNIPYAIQLFSGNDEEGALKLGIATGSYNELAQQISEVAVQAQKQQTQAASATTSNTTAPTQIDWQAQPRSEAELNRLIQSKELDGYLLLKGAGKDAFPTVTLVSDNDAASAQTLLQSAAQTVKLRSVAGGQLNEQQLQELSSPVTIVHQSPDQQGSGGTDDNGRSYTRENFILVYILMILFFISLTMTGNMVASEITSEKSSRVMEILITSVSPLTQMFGKIIGIFLVGITQMGVYAVVVIAHLFLPYYQDVLAQFNLHVSNLSWHVAVLGFMFYILGYFLYSTLYAAVGSIVSRTEDLGQAVSILTVLTLAAFYIGIFSISNPNSLIIRIASYVPFFAPTTALIRIGLGTIAWWEVLVSTIILLVSILVCGWISTKIYRTGVLMYGKRPTWKELRRAMKAYKI